MVILKEKLSIESLKKMAAAGFGDMVKGVVDVENGLLALDAQLHSDLEALLLQNGSKQANLWGINLYHEAESSDFIEYDSMINIRPSTGNKTRGVEDAITRQKIEKIVAEWITS